MFDDRPIRNIDNLANFLAPYLLTEYKEVRKDWTRDHHLIAEKDSDLIGLDGKPVKEYVNILLNYWNPENYEGNWECNIDIPAIALSQTNDKERDPNLLVISGFYNNKGEGYFKVFRWRERSRQDLMLTLWIPNNELYNVNGTDYRFSSNVMADSSSFDENVAKLNPKYEQFTKLFTFIRNDLVALMKNKLKHDVELKRKGGRVSSIIKTAANKKHGFKTKLFVTSRFDSSESYKEETKGALECYKIAVGWGYDKTFQAFIKALKSGKTLQFKKDCSNLSFSLANDACIGSLLPSIKNNNINKEDPKNENNSEGGLFIVGSKLPKEQAPMNNDKELDIAAYFRTLSPEDIDKLAGTQEFIDWAKNYPEDYENYLRS